MEYNEENDIEKMNNVKKDKNYNKSYSSDASISELNTIRNPCVHIFMVLSSIILITSIVFSVFTYYLFQRDSLMTFTFSEGRYLPFHPKIWSVLIVLGILIIFVTLLVVMMFTSKLRESYIKSIYSDYGKYFVIQNLLLSAGFFVGFFMPSGKEEFYFHLGYCILFLVSSFLCFQTYVKIKRQKNLPVIANLGTYLLISILLSFQVYCFLYNLIFIICHDKMSSDPHTIGELANDLSIVSNVVYALVTIGKLAYYKDLYSTITLLIIELSFLTNSQNIPEKEFITSIVISSFMLLSGVIILCKYKSATLGYETDKEVESLIQNYKHSREIEVQQEKEAQRLNNRSV